MARNASGTYALPAGNPVVTATIIQSSWANTTLSDLATEMTDSLDRSGKGGMLAPLLSVDGTQLLPGLSFNLETSTGVFRPAANTLGFSVAGTEQLRLTGAGVLNLYTATPTIVAAAANASLALKGNRAAGDAGTDLVLTSVATRTAGNLLDVQNNGVSKLQLDFGGSLILNGSGIVFAAAANAVLTLRGNKAAADAGTDVVISSTATRTAGTLLDVQNNGATRFQLDSAGNIAWQTSTGPFVTSNLANSTITIRGNRNPADGGSDLILNGQQTRTAGILVDVQNNGVSKARVTFNGVVHSPNTRQYAETTADQSSVSIAGTDITGLGFAVAANTEYEWEGMIEGLASGTGDLVAVINGPAAPTLVTFDATQVNPVTNAIQQSLANAFTSSIRLVVSGNAIRVLVKVKGHLRNGANAGTVQYQLATSVAGQSVTVGQGSHLRWRVVGGGFA